MSVPRHARQHDFFYLAMGLTVALVATIGFSRTIGDGLIHRASPPFLLYVHAPLFAGWVLLFIAQAALVYVGRTRWHRRLGLVGLVIGAAMPPVTLGLRLAEGSGDGDGFLIVTLFDLLAFATTFWLAVYWRRRPDRHRRLMLMATCGITSAAFARFPHWLMPPHSWYLGVDLLLLAAVIHDRIVERRVHPVYRYGLPMLALGQAMVMAIYMSHMPAWLAIAHRILR